MEFLNDKKRKAEGDLLEALLEMKAVQDEMKAGQDEMKAELVATKKEVLELKKLLTEEGNDMAVSWTEKAQSSPADSKTDAHHEEPDELSDDDELSVVDPADKWMTMLRQLREYRILNGHCNVPRTHPKLGKWVDNQRLHYKNFKLGSGHKIKEERIPMLESIGMTWGKSFPSIPSWDEHLEEYKKYKSAMRCDPPVNPDKPNSLAIWVSTQRNEYRRFKKGRDSLLTVELIGQLNDAAFTWKGPRLT